MRNTIFIIILFLPTQILFAQIIPIQSTEDELQKLNVKSIAVDYYSNHEKNKQLIYKKDFSPEGNVTGKYQLSLWDAVSNSHTTSYKYNEKDQLVEELKIQEILNLFERDENYIETFGDFPLNEKMAYLYNENGQLSEKQIYIFETASPNDQASPNQSIFYEYNSDKMISEESSSSEEKFFNHNYLIKYVYDSIGNLIGKTLAYGKEREFHRSTIYRYDAQNQRVEEQIIDPSIPHNNVHYKYDYDEEGKISNEYVYDEAEDEFELEASYNYDKNGNAISGKREVKFDYYENGLIKSEIWNDPKTNELVTFSTSYEYF